VLLPGGANADNVWTVTVLKCFLAPDGEMFLSNVLVPDDANADNVWTLSVLKCF
jgi:hypothetical protein